VNQLIADLERSLPGYISTRRWFRAKARTIRQVEVKDVLEAPGNAFFILIAGVHYEDAGSDEYLLPVAIAWNAKEHEEAIGAVSEGNGGREGLAYNALLDEPVRKALLRAVECEETLPGRAGVIRAERTSAFVHLLPLADALPDSFVSRAEQSNTSIVYRDRFILKLFRKLEMGVNPDIEIGRFLTERGFRNTPAVYGGLEYRRPGDAAPHAAGILQQFVANRGDAWKYTLDSLSEYFSRAFASEGGALPELPAQHPLELAEREAPAGVRALLGEYYTSAQLLGTRTAEMHAALTDPDGGPDFAPEPFTAADARSLYEETKAQASGAFNLLRLMLPAMNAAAVADARAVLQLESKIFERLGALQNASSTGALRIRHHGDYHLGQVLYTGQDFMIVDFEGEPARPLTERRAKALAMRDVAGMLRSFQYAAYAALFGQVSGVSPESVASHRVEHWSAFWTAWIGAAFLRAYLDRARPFAFVSPQPAARRLALDALLLQKAVYEVNYELNNRPDWVRIPLRGILNLVASNNVLSSRSRDTSCE
jgi:maltose alpha-D-glucosyltransferase / alpha-amylase